MLLNGITLRGARVGFELSDCPVYLTEDVIGLAGVERSKLILANTIVRGDESTGMIEGDIVLDENENVIGYIIYSQGFKVQTLSNEIKKLEEYEHIQMKKGDKESILQVTGSEHRTELLFKCNRQEFFMALFLCKNKNGTIAVSGKTFKCKSLNPNEIHFYTGVTDTAGNKLFYGELYKGGVISLVNGLPCVCVGDKNTFI